MTKVGEADAGVDMLTYAPVTLLLLRTYHNVLYMLTDHWLALKLTFVILHTTIGLARLITTLVCLITIY